MTSLSELCDLIVDCEHKTAPTVRSGFPLIRTPDIGLGRLDIDGAQRVDESTYRAWTQRAIPQPGDLILAREAPVGNVGPVLPGVQPVLGQRTVLIRPRADALDPMYLNYLLCGPQLRGWMHGVSSGATVPHLNMADIRSMALPPLPPLRVQRKIAAILSAYDDLIANNSRRIKILEEMAQRIYREWFVEFRYPGHEAVPLVQSDAGLIPQGWVWSSLGAVAEWTSGGTPPTSNPTFWGGDIPWIGSGALTEFLISRSDRRVTEAGARAGTRLVGRDAVLLVVRGMSLAKEVRMGITERSVAFSQDCKALVANPGIEPIYLAFTLRASSERLLGMVEYAAHGTGLLATDRVQAIEVVVPAPDVQRRFTEFAGCVRGEIATLTTLLANLRATRDVLLPRLVSGAIDVSALNIDVTDLAA